MAEMKCTITIIETDGRLSIFAKIPDGAESTIAGVLAARVLEVARQIMRDATGRDEQVEKIQ